MAAGGRAGALEPRGAGGAPVLRSEHGLADKARRAAWGIAWGLLFRPSHRLMYGWRRTLLRAFGARIGYAARIYPSARIWAPWNLEVGARATVGPDVQAYSVASICIGADAVVSQGAHLCAASHDIDAPGFDLLRLPVAIGAHAWVAAEAFVGPGVTVGEGAVVGARACAVRDVPPWTVVVGNPARHLRDRSRAVVGRG